MSKIQCGELKGTVVFAPLAVFLIVAGVYEAFWSPQIISPEKVLQISEPGAILNTLEDGQPDVSLTDCDVCVMVHVGDDGANPPSEKNLPFTLLHKLFETVRKIEKPARRDKVMCVGVDHPIIACRMVRDALGPDANCWQFEAMPLRETPVICNHMVVGKTSQYLPQLSTFENRTSGRFAWHQIHVVELDSIADPSPPVVNVVRPTIVTGFSANHLSSGLLLLRSIANATCTARETNASFTVSVVVWAMEEFRGKDRDDLLCVVKEMNETWGLNVEVRRFKFWQFPEWMRIKQAHEGFNEFGTGEYAWKVVMIHTVLLERGLVLWTDAGDRFKTTESLTETLNNIADNGFASRRTGGIISLWTHRGMIQYLRAMQLDLSKSNCDGSAVGFSFKRYEELVRPWYECAMTRQCIAPEGSNRTNHRQDQAALTVLAYMSNSSCTGVHSDELGKHMDHNLGAVVGAVSTSCYHDPRQS